MDRFEYVMALIPIIFGLSIAGFRSRQLRVHEVAGAAVFFPRLFQSFDDLTSLGFLVRN